jgi:hypothetical protein
LIGNYLQVIDKALAVGADSSQYPDGWIVRYREKKPGKAFIEGMLLNLRFGCYFHMGFFFYYEKLDP